MSCGTKMGVSISSPKFGGGFVLKIPKPMPGAGWRYHLSFSRNRYPTLTSLHSSTPGYRA
jgi:hypothetical protein